MVRPQGSRGPDSAPTLRIPTRSEVIVGSAPNDSIFNDAGQGTAVNLEAPIQLWLEERVGIPLDLMATARLIGESAWIEHRLFEVLGRWSLDGADPALVVALADHARRHAWHTEVLLARLPELVNVDKDLLFATTPNLESFFDEVENSNSSIERCVAAYRVMCPHLLVRYKNLIARIGPASAPSLRRWLTFLVSDLTEEWLDGETQCRRLLVSVEAIESATARQGALELMLLT